MGKENLNLRAWRFLQGEGYTLIPNRLMLAILTAGVDRKLGRSAQVVLFALASRRNLRHREASPEDLHALTGIGLRTLRKVLAELWELGLVDKGAYGYALSSGAEALGEELPQAQERKALPARKTLPERRKNLPRSRDESSVQKGVCATARNKKGEVKEVKEKNPLHPHAHGQSPWTEEEGSTQRKGQGETLPGGEGLGASPSVPTAAGGPPETPKASPPLVNEGTKPLQRALKGAGLWQGFYRVFRPGFPSEALWSRYLARLEREGLPLGEAFLAALARTLERAALGAVRFPAPYLDRLLEEVRKEASPPPPPPPTEVAFDHGDLLLLPDGRRGYFAGWTARGAKAFVEWDGTAYLVPREVLLGARVVG